MTGDRLKLLRKTIGLTQEQLAQRLGIGKAARFDHRKGRFADAKMLSQLFLRHAQLFSYQFYPRVHSF